MKLLEKVLFNNGHAVVKIINGGEGGHFTNANAEIECANKSCLDLLKSAKNSECICDSQWTIQAREA